MNMSVQVSSAKLYMAQPSLKQCLIILQTPPVIHRDLWSLLALSLLSVLCFISSHTLIYSTERPPMQNWGAKLRFGWKGAETQRHKRQSELSLCLSDMELSCQPPFPSIDSRLFFTACMNHSLQCVSATSAYNFLYDKSKHFLQRLV